MGEWSKKIGDYGEDTVRDFLNLIGWNANNHIKGKELQCNDARHVNKKGEVKRTHGIDILYTYHCPLVDGL